jgi:hypothetical protein
MGGCWHRSRRPVEGFGRLMAEMPDGSTMSVQRTLPKRGAKQTRRK